MMRLKSKLLSLNVSKAHETKIFSPANTEELRIPFMAEKTAKVVGRLAQNGPPKFDDGEDHILSGVLVQNDFKLSLMAPEDLREYAGLTTTTIICKQHLTLSAAGVDLIKWGLEGVFGSIEDITAKEDAMEAESATNGNGMHGEAADEEADGNIQAFTFLVMGCVKVHYKGRGAITVEWEGNARNDGLADAVLASLSSVETSPAAVKRE